MVYKNNTLFLSRNIKTLSTNMTFHLNKAKNKKEKIK